MQYTEKAYINDEPLAERAHHKLRLFLRLEIDNFRGNDTMLATIVWSVDYECVCVAFIYLFFKIKFFANVALAA